MSRLIALGTVLLAVLVSGGAAGFWSGRWGSPSSLREAAARLERVPLTAGESWDGHTAELSEREVALTELEGYLNRRYVHRDTGAVVTVLLVCGRPGPVSVHTPEVCFSAAGYGQVGAARAYDGPAGSRARFRVLDLRKGNPATPTSLRIFLAWGSNGEWSAPANPRLTFAGRPYLYKLYVIREMTRAGESLEEDPAGELITGLLPQLQEALFPGA
jgi:hypothetical protein